jgi:uncharacterized protein (TIGR02231 family)
MRLATGLVVLLAAPAAAAELQPQAPIEAVIVYPSGAGVSRTANVTLPVGTTDIVLTNLPAEIEPDSIKVEGAGSGDFAIGSVATLNTPADADADPARVAITRTLGALDDERSAIEDRIAALTGRQTFIERMIEETPEGFAKMLAENAGGIEKWSAASLALGGDLEAVAKAKRGLEIDKRKVEEQIAAKQRELDALPPLRDSIELRVEASAEQQVTASLTITYRVSSARWSPAYDALLDTGEGGGKAALSIVRRAEVVQETGEDWSGVALTLSTMRPTAGTSVPWLDPTLVTLSYGREYDASGNGLLMRNELPAAAPAESKALVDAEARDDGDRAKAARVMEAAADFGDFHAEYRVPGTVTLASGTGNRSFRIATLTAAPELDVRAAPQLAPAAYLTARLTAPDRAPFLAGPVSLFRDGAFVGKGSVPFTNAGAKFELGFGEDDLVKVKRVALDRATAEHGILSSRKTDTRKFRIDVENLHSQPMKITILDRVPYAEDETITIARLDGSTKPTAENVDDRRGILAWSDTYAPGEAREILNGYRVTWPADREVVLMD